jgi:glycosyltransferase involved in cell wall biosynthesis
VVIPTHNRRDLLLRTVDSVLQQRDVDVTVVVVDDGGTDGTPDAIRGLGRPNLRLLRHEKSRGVSGARNAGLETTETPWVAFVDDDDMWAPDKLGAQLASLREQPDARWSCVGAVRVDSNLRVISQHAAPPSGDVSERLLRRNVIPGGGSGVLASVALARAIGGFDEKISILADWDFYLRLSLEAPVAAANRPLVAHYLHSDSMYYDPTGIIRELFYLEGKYRDLPSGTRFHADHAEWFLDFAIMSRRLGSTNIAATLLRRGVREAGLLPLAGEALSRVAPALRRRLDGRDEAPFTFDEPVEPWLRRYARPADVAS